MEGEPFLDTVEVLEDATDSIGFAVGFGDRVGTDV